MKMPKLEDNLLELGIILVVLFLLLLIYLGHTISVSDVVEFVGT